MLIKLKLGDQMALSATARQNLNIACDVVRDMAGGAGLGYLCARIFTTINPVAGAIFGATATLISKLARPVFKSLFEGPGANESSKTIGWLLENTVGILASAAITTYAGYSMTAYSALILTVSALAAPLIIVVGAVLLAGSIDAIRLNSSY